MTNHRKEYKKKYYAEHRDEILSKNKKWREDNKAYKKEYDARRWTAKKEEKRIYDAAKRKENPEIFAERYRRWRSANLEYCRERLRAWLTPERIRARNMRRRGLRENAVGTCTVEQALERVAYYDNRCAYCGGPYQHLDHVIPLSRGGSNWPANLRPSCAACNTSKGAKTLAEWRSTRGTP